VDILKVINGSQAVLVLVDH